MHGPNMEVGGQLAGVRWHQLYLLRHLARIIIPHLKKIMNLTSPLELTFLDHSNILYQVTKNIIGHTLF